MFSDDQNDRLITLEEISAFLDYIPLEPKYVIASLHSFDESAINQQLHQVMPGIRISSLNELDCVLQGVTKEYFLRLFADDIKMGEELNTHSSAVKTFCECESDQTKIDEKIAESSAFQPKYVEPKNLIFELSKDTYMEINILGVKLKFNPSISMIKAIHGLNEETVDFIDGLVLPEPFKRLMERNNPLPISYFYGSNPLVSPQIFEQFLGNIPLSLRSFSLPLVGFDISDIETELSSVVGLEGITINKSAGLSASIGGGMSSDVLMGFYKQLYNAFEGYDLALLNNVQRVNANWDDGVGNSVDLNGGFVQVVHNNPIPEFVDKLRALKTEGLYIRTCYGSKPRAPPTILCN